MIECKSDWIWYFSQGKIQWNKSVKNVLYGWNRPKYLSYDFILLFNMTKINFKFSNVKFTGGNRGVAGRLQLFGCIGWYFRCYKEDFISLHPLLLTLFQSLLILLSRLWRRRASFLPVCGLTRIAAKKAFYVLHHCWTVWCIFVWSLRVLLLPLLIFHCLDLLQLLLQFQLFILFWRHS